MRSLVLALVLAVATLPAVAADAAPAFSVRDLSNTTQTLAQYKGKVVLLNFWATFCGPCKVEMPHLQALYQELGPKGLVILGISMDDARFQAQVKPMAMGLRLTYPIIADPQGVVYSKYNPGKTMPYNVIVDTQGRIAHVHSGYNPGDEKTVRAEIEALLAKP